MVIRVPDVPSPLARLCYKQNLKPPNAMARCQRKKGHGGMHDWEMINLLASRDRELYDVGEALDGQYAGATPCAALSVQRQNQALERAEDERADLKTTLETSVPGTDYFKLRDLLQAREQALEQATQERDCPETPAYYAEAVHLICDELEKLSPSDLDGRRIKIVATLRNAAWGIRRAEATSLALQAQLDQASSTLKVIVKMKKCSAGGVRAIHIIACPQCAAADTLAALLSAPQGQEGTKP